MHRIAEQSRVASADADAVVASPLGLFVGRQLAELLGVPLLMASYLPLGTTGAFPSPLISIAPNLGGPANRLTHFLSHQLMWQPFRPAVNEVRRDVFGLPALSRRSMVVEIGNQRWPAVFGYSNHVVPKPADWRGGRTWVTGYWFLEEPGWEPPAGLVEFLSSGQPPVVVGFGSMALDDAAATATLVSDALSQTRQRGVLMGALAKAGNLPRHVYAIEWCPHEWLFPQSRVAVHHGGAGTTAAALRAGTPSVVVPFFADQPFWGWRVSALAVGPRPIPRRKLTADLLASAISVAASDQVMRSRAEALGGRIRTEDGVRRAVEAFRISLGRVTART
jgi:sterol 3beta-glucosyltransferase